MSWSKRKGTILLLAIFLIMFSITIFGVGYIYTRDIVQKNQIYSLKSSLIPMYEIYNSKLIDMIDRKIFQPSETPSFLEKINYIFLESDLNINHTYEYTNNNHNSNDGYVDGHRIVDPKKIEMIFDRIINASQIHIDQVEHNNIASVKFLGESQNGAEENVLGQFSVNLSPLFNRRQNFLRNFSMTEEDMKQKVKQYIEFLIQESLGSFINGFDEYKNGKLRFIVKVNPEKFLISDYSGGWEVYAPYSITYELTSLKGKQSYTDNHKYVLYLKPYYVINLTVKLRRENEQELHVILRGQATIEISRIIKIF